VARVQLKNLFVQGTIARLEGAMAKREQLADGLALVDFEQLEIENSTLVEKIDERNEEIAKLRKKTTTAVQTLTHMREKLHFVSADVARLSVELATLEHAVTEQRARLGVGRKERERTRFETERARGQQGFAYADQLAIDFEVRKRTVLVKKGELEDVMRDYDAVEAATRALSNI
jgi:histone deacetylase 6